MFKKLNLNLDLVELEKLQSIPDGVGADTFQEHRILDLQRVLDTVAPQVKFNIRPDYSNFTFIKRLHCNLIFFSLFELLNNIRVIYFLFFEFNWL